MEKNNIVYWKWYMEDDDEEKKMHWLINYENHLPNSPVRKEQIYMRVVMVVVVVVVC